MTGLLGIIIPALLPAVSDGFKGLFQKLFGGTKPISVEEQVKMMEAETAKLQALAALDAPAATVSPWVADLRASFRYILAGAIVLGTLFFVLIYMIMAYLLPENTALQMVWGILELFITMSQSVFAFAFGDRVYLSLKKGR